jgi:hypothetical protein
MAVRADALTISRRSQAQWPTLRRAVEGPLGEAQQALEAEFRLSRLQPNEIMGQPQTLTGE